MANIRYILNLLWVVFGVYWFASAFRTASRGKRIATDEASRWRWARLAILAVTFVLLLSSSLSIGPLGWRFVPHSAEVAWLGVAITVAGIALAAWARQSLGENWSDKIVLKVDHQLVRNGPYAYLRHPIYSGVLLGIAGTALAVGEVRGILALVLLGSSYWVKAIREEKVLVSQFGDAFEDYRRSAGFLIPRLRH